MMEIENHRISVQKTAYYYTLGSLSNKTRYIWFVCHGYAESAKEFIRKFDFLDPNVHFIVAAEGFSRFYKDGFYGDVVASWMTKEDRLNEINDYANYLQKLYKRITAQAPEEVNIILFGFSQGGSTVYRWITSKFPYFDVYINWAGWIPEDIDYSSSLDYLNSKKIFFLYGLEDSFLPQEKIAELNTFCQDNKLKVKFYHFDGKHRIKTDFLKSFLQKSLKVSLV
jgi:predicted esterase